MSRFDLHTHSDVSDGAFDPATVIRLAAEAGLDGIALTDHDSMGGVPVARAEGERIGLEVITGCEISARWGEVSVHMLAYNVDPEHPRLAEELRWIREDRVVRAEKMVQLLQGLGVPITFEQVRAIAKGESIGRPHVAQALVDLGVIATTPDAFTTEWIGEGGRANVHKKALTPQDTVRLAAEAGGVSGIAHPIWIERDHDGDANTLIEELTELGLGVLEVNHPDHDEPTRARFAAIADRLGLVKTSSSDYHGNQHGGRLGENAASEEVVQALREKSASTK
ncbi:MAG: PHP domain-containing protein [Actinomycetota bacterium]